MSNQRPFIGPHLAPGREASQKRVRSRFTIALAISLALHALILSLELYEPGFSLPGFKFPWTEKRVQAPDLTVRLAQAPLPQPPPAAAPRPPRAAGKSAPAATVASPRGDADFEALSPVPARARPPRKRSRSRREAGGPARPARIPASPPGIPPAPRPEILAQEIPREDTFSVPPPLEESQEAEDGRRKEEEAKQEQEARRLAMEEERRKAEDDGQKEEEARQELARQEQETQRLALEAASRKAEVERQKEEEAQQELARQEQETQRLALETARREAEDERRKEEARQKEEAQAQAEEARRMALEEAKRKEEEKKQAETRRIALEAEAARRTEDAARQQAAARQKELEARQRAAEEATWKAEVERQKEQEAKQLEELAAVRAQEAADRRRAEEAVAQAARERLATRPAPAAPGASGPDGASPVPGTPSGKELAAKVLGQLRMPGAASDSSRLPSPPGRIENARRHSVFGTERDVMLRWYVESWRMKIERNGPLNYRPSAGQRASDDPVVTVAIRSDGSLEDVHIHRSSGLRELDEAVRRIARLYAPYSAFPPELARLYDVIEIRRVWQFEGTLRILEEMH